MVLKRFGVGPVGQRQVHARGQVGLSIPLIAVAHGAVHGVKALRLGLRLGRRFNGVPGIGSLWGGRGIGRGSFRGRNDRRGRRGLGLSSKQPCITHSNGDNQQTSCKK